MNNTYDNDSLINHFSSLPVDAEYFDVLDAVIENEHIDPIIKKQMIKTLFADSMRNGYGSNFHKDNLQYYKKILERFTNEDFTNLYGETYQEIWQVVYNHFSTKIPLNRTKCLSELINSKKIFAAFSDVKYGGKNAYVHIVESLLAEQEFSLSKAPVLLEWFEDEKNDISTLSENQKKKILWFISMPINEITVPHDRLGLNDNRTKYSGITDIYSIFLDHRTLSIDDDSYYELLELCLPYDTGYSSHKDSIVPNNYKPLIIHEVLSKTDFTKTQYSMVLKYLHKILENGILGINNNQNDVVPFSFDELLHLSLIKIISDEEFLSLNDEELQEKLDRIVSSEIPVLEALVVRDLNDDESKSEIAKDFYKKYVQDYADEPLRQNRALRLLNKIKDYPEAKFEKACSIYGMNTKQASKIIDRSLNLSTEQLESYEYVIKRLKIEDNAKEQELNDKKIDFLESVINSNLISLYSIGVVVNFVELGLSLHDMGDDKVNLYAAYCEKRGIELSEAEKKQSTILGSASVTQLSVTERMLRLLTSTEAENMNDESRNYYAYDILRTKTNEVLFEQDAIKHEPNIQSMVADRENKVKQIGRATAFANKYSAIM